MLLLSCIQADIHVIPYSPPVTGHHLWFLTYPDTRQCLEQFCRVAWHRKHRYSRWKFRCYLAYKLRCTLFSIHFRLLAAIIDLSLTPTHGSAYNSPIVLLDIDNIGIIVGISLLSRIQAEKYAIPYSLPVTGHHLWCITYPDVGQCLH